MAAHLTHSPLHHLPHPIPFCGLWVLRQRKQILFPQPARRPCLFTAAVCLFRLDYLWYDGGSFPFTGGEKHGRKIKLKKVGLAVVVAEGARLKLAQAQLS